MSDDEQLKADGAEESAPRIPSKTPSPPDMALFDDVDNEPLEPLNVISSALPGRDQLPRESNAEDSQSPPPPSEPAQLEPADIEEPPSSDHRLGAAAVPSTGSSRQRIMLKIPDDDIPQSSPRPPDVEQSSRAAASVTDAVIHAMRIISVGEPPPLPPEPEGDDEELEPEDEAAAAAALNTTDLQPAWSPPAAWAAPPHASTQTAVLPNQPSAVDVNEAAAPLTPAESSFLDDEELEPDSDVPDAPLAEPLGTADRWDDADVAPTPSPPIATVPLSPTASAPPPPVKSTSGGGRQAMQSQPLSRTEPSASPSADEDEDSDELTDEELSPDSSETPEYEPDESAWGSPPVSPGPSVVIREGSGETPAPAVAASRPIQPLYGRGTQPDGLENAAQQAIHLSMPEAPPPPPAPRAAPPPAREPTPPPRPTAESRPEERLLRRGRRTRPGWEEVFSDDFVRSYRQLTPAQIAREASFIEESLGVQRGGVVLDLGCGTGQQAVELAARGYNVVGYDLSLTMLALAADEAQERAQKINFLQGDMREMAFEEMFDGVYSWATSFGFFDEEKNASVVRRVHRSLRKGGLFLLDLVNRDYIVARLPALAWFEGDGCVCIDDAQFDSITSRLRVKRTIMLEDGTSREVEYSVRLYSLHEIGRVLHEAGFKVVEVSGHPATPGAFFDAESPRVITLAERR